MNFITLAVALSPLTAQNLVKGDFTFNTDDHATALKQYRPLAKAGNVATIEVTK